MLLNYFFYNTFFYNKLFFNWKSFLTFCILLVHREALHADYVKLNVDGSGGLASVVCVGSQQNWRGNCLPWEKGYCRVNCELDCKSALDFVKNNVHSLILLWFWFQIFMHSYPWTGIHIIVKVILVQVNRLVKNGASVQHPITVFESCCMFSPSVLLFLLIKKITNNKFDWSFFDIQQCWCIEKAKLKY